MNGEKVALDSMTLEQLKALWFDQYHILRRAEQNLQAIGAEMNTRNANDVDVGPG